MKKIYSLLMALAMVWSATAMPVLSKAEAGKTLETAALVSTKDFGKMFPAAQSAAKAPMAEHTWGAWADFAPKGDPTGDYTHSIMISAKSLACPVQVRYATDEPALAQVKVSNWGKGVFSASGVDFIFEWNTTTNQCVVPEQFTGYTHSSYGQVMIADVSVWQGKDYYNIFPCTYNPATGTFSLSLVYKVSAGQFGYSGDNNGHTAETLVMNAKAAPVTGDTIRYTMTRNANWVDYAATQGWFQLYQNDGHYNVSISTDNSPLNEGEFQNDDLDASYTYISIDGTKLVASNLHAVISKSGNVVTGVLWVTDKTSGDVYEVTLTHDPSKPLGLANDSYEGVEMTFATSDITTNSASGTTTKTITFRAQNDKAEIIALTLYASNTDADIVIPEGEYTFASTKAAGTALISNGISNSAVTLSYAGIIADGYINDVWFLREGKVTVQKVTIDGAPAIYMVVEAKNSWGFDVKVTVGSKGTPTAISNTAAEGKAVKMVKNGQMVIIKNGVQYNALGAQL